MTETNWQSKQNIRLLDSLLKRTAEAASRGDQGEYDRLSKIVVRVTKEISK